MKQANGIGRWKKIHKVVVVVLAFWLSAFYLISLCHHKSAQQPTIQLVFGGLVAEQQVKKNDKGEW